MQIVSRYDYFLLWFIEYYVDLVFGWLDLENANVDKRTAVSDKTMLKPGNDDSSSKEFGSFCHL